MWHLNNLYILQMKCLNWKCYNAFQAICVVKICLFGNLLLAMSMLPTFKFFHRVLAIRFLVVVPTTIVACIRFENFTLFLVSWLHIRFCAVSSTNNINRATTLTIHLLSYLFIQSRALNPINCKARVIRQWDYRCLWTIRKSHYKEYVLLPIIKGLHASILRLIPYGSESEYMCSLASFI